MNDKVKILIVEDEAITAMDLQDTLEQLGYEVVAVAATGEEAIQYAGQYRPDLALMDIHLASEMDGITTAQKIRDQYQTPIIYTTAFSDEQLVKRASFTEPFGYIIKPYNQRELHSNIEIGLFKSRIMAELRLTLQEAERLNNLCLHRECRIRELEEYNVTLQETIMELLEQIPD